MSDHSYAELEVTFLRASEDGREQAPLLDGHGYSPHLRVPPFSDLLGVMFVDGPEGPVEVGVPTYATVRFLYEGVSYERLVVGALVEVVEGTRVVGRGRVTRR